MFDVVETFHVIDRSEHPPHPFSAKYQRVVAVWLRQENDSPSDLFQGQIVCLAPDGTELAIGEVDDFTFSEPVYRWNTTLLLPGLTQKGVYVIEARLRRLGEQDWTERQAFSFLVQETVTPSVPAATTLQEANESEKADDHDIKFYFFVHMIVMDLDKEERDTLRNLVRKSFNKVKEMYEPPPEFRDKLDDGPANLPLYVSMFTRFFDYMDKSEREDRENNPEKYTT